MLLFGAPPSFRRPLDELCNSKTLTLNDSDRWWNDWVQQLQIEKMGLQRVLDMALQLRGSELCKASAKKIIALLENPVSRARLEVQLGASIDFGRPFCKAGFNLEGDADGLAFCVHAEIKKTAEVIAGRC